MKSTTFRQLMDPLKGPLYQRVCIICDNPITSKSFAGLLPVLYCENVTNPNCVEDDDASENAPTCQNVRCGECNLPSVKRNRTQRDFAGYNGR